MSHSKVVVKDHGMDSMFDRIKKIRKATVKVGVLADSEKGGAAHPGRPGKKQKSHLTVAQIAAILHWGTKDKRIPPRPFMDMAFAKERDQLAAMGARLIIAVALGKIPLEKALNMMGAKLANAAKAVIVAGVPPPNKPAVAAAKARKGKTARLFTGPTAGQQAMSAARETHRRWKVGTKVTDVGGVFKAIASEMRLQQRRDTASKIRHVDRLEKQRAAVGSVKPLIDTGRLLNAITWAIEGKGSDHGH